MKGAVLEGGRGQLLEKERNLKVSKLKHRMVAKTRPLCRDRKSQEYTGMIEAHSQVSDGKAAVFFKLYSPPGMDKNEFLQEKSFPGTWNGVLYPEALGV